MLAYTKGKVESLLKLEFVRFCIVGGLGFTINFILLAAITKFTNLPKGVAQLPAAEVALGTNFWLHHNWTYKTHHVNKNLKSLVIQFHATCWPAIVGSTIMVGLFTSIFHMGEFLALAISSIVTFGWNFGWSKFVIWRDVTEKDIKEITK